MKSSFGWTALSVFAAGLLFVSCETKRKGFSVTPEDSVAIVNENLEHRALVEDFFANSPDSPFQRDTLAVYHGIRWYPINPYFRGKSILHKYEDPETVVVLGTKGEERRNLRYGYFEFNVPDDSGAPAPVRVNVYKFTPHDKRRYELYRNNLSLWFTDKTTGKETYEVGRYIELGDENPDPNYLYTVDFNKAFNPYCAYSDMYSCAIPRKEDHLNLAIRAGELKYHE